MLEPLSSILRPNSLDNLVWQSHLVGKWMPLRQFIELQKIPSMVFWWPPGTGKTTVAYIISKLLNTDFHRLSWVSSKKEDLNKIIVKAVKNFQNKIPTIIFLDEIHRWNKAQQDWLLPYVEKGIITLIWATTENPSFTINNALLSRLKVFVFNSLEPEEIYNSLKKNLSIINEKYPKIKINDKILHVISQLSNWDLRNAINTLENVIILKKTWELKEEDIKKVFDRPLYYDKDTDEHYNIISAIHKSLRDSDADAACYWIGRMLYSWEDPLFIARRLIRFASEDIWIQDPFAFVLANNTYEAIQKVWMPECDLFLYELAIYLARAKKDNSIYKMSFMIKEDIAKYWNLPVPLHIRNAPTKLMKDLKYWAWYKYAHDFKDAKVDQEHFPEKLKGRKYLES